MINPALFSVAEVSQGEVSTSIAILTSVYKRVSVVRGHHIMDTRNRRSASHVNRPGLYLREAFIWKKYGIPTKLTKGSEKSTLSNC